MTPPELPTGAAGPAGALRPSDAERERALGMLRDGAGSGRLSHETFLGRMDVVLRATSRGELDAAVAGLPTGGPVERFVLRTVGRISAFGDRLGRAWRTERLPGLSLPQGGVRQLTIGRLPGSGLRLHDASVSRNHAELRHERDGWVLYDLGSTNGTHVNGRRIAGGVPVRPGDQVRFGNLEFRLAAF
ncbi:FHA domain-containing protein [Kitasatospora sp. NPDC018619]|uniref:FHA domain-containing protein n=1 Tax=unclassified Kitasatospora TaxID=2633591 RepID=UPI00379B2FCD